MTSWQIAFTVLQIVFVLVMGWAVKVVMNVKKDYTELEKRVVELEKTDAVKDERIKNIECGVQRIEKTLTEFIAQITQRLQGIV